MLGDPSKENWALDSAASTYANVMIDACRTAGFEPRVNARCNSFEVVRALVRSGCSISITPKLRAHDCDGGLVLKATRPRMVRQLSIAYRRGETRNPSIAAFIAQLHAAVRVFPAD
ncbi:hypothetical protein EZH22_02335 [Xanthobacter dioxanivorans]|uniref:LysR substrate-binding domain-containing protein n=1 Tax=Xanthobacter dioxanivorans TaxID=2528964 RepID=A0A974PPB6_9HYPH|nr:hypothetical protein EZH22_02335 [Xanthobacter dioxanivorans]